MGSTRGEVDDRAAALVQHRRQHGARHRRRADERGVDVGGPRVGVRLVQEPDRLHGAGIVDEDGRRADLHRRLAHDGADGVGIRHVAGKPDGAALGAFARDGLGVIATAGGHDHVRAGFGERLRRGGADAALGAGDEGDFSVEHGGSDQSMCHCRGRR